MAVLPQTTFELSLSCYMLAYVLLAMLSQAMSAASLIACLLFQIVAPCIANTEIMKARTEC